MAVKILESTHFGGMPTMDYKIVIDKVNIELDKETFTELSKEISDSVAKNHHKALQVYDKHWENHKKFHAMIKEFRNLFYDGGEEGDMFFKKELHELDLDKIHEFLDQNSKMLGFQ